jgi:hypothetical protein
MASLLRDISIDVGDFSSKNGARLSLSFDSRASAGIIESKVVFYDTNTKNMREHASLPWKVVSMTHARNAGALLTYVLGEDGQTLVIEKEKVWENSIAKSPEFAKGRGPLRKVRAIKETPVAVGMDRQVFALSDGTWSNISAPGTKATVSGFEAVAGASLKDMYCAGWDGEIWHRFDDQWNQVDSPTDILITDIVLVDGKIYGCGLAGLILRGSESTWETLDQGRFKFDLYSIAAFENRIFVASLHGVYELKDDVLYDVDFGADFPKSAHTLCTVEGGMAAIGAKDLFLLDKQWRRLE